MIGAEVGLGLIVKARPFCVLHRCPINLEFASLTGGNRHVSYPVGTSGTVFSNPLKYFFLWLWVISSHACTISTQLNPQRKPFVDHWHSPCAAPMFCPVRSSPVSLSRPSAPSPQFAVRKTPPVSPSLHCLLGTLQAGSWSPWRAHFIFSHLSEITGFHYTMSSSCLPLFRVSSYILSIWLFRVRG